MGPRGKRHFPLGCASSCRTGPHPHPRDPGRDPGRDHPAGSLASTKSPWVTLWNSTWSLTDPALLQGDLNSPPAGDAFPWQLEETQSFSFYIQINKPRGSTPVQSWAVTWFHTPERRRNSVSLPQSELTGMDPAQEILSLLPSQAPGAAAQQPPSQHTSRLQGLEQLSLPSSVQPVVPSQVDFGPRSPWHARLSWPARRQGHVGDAHVCEASSQAHACCEKGNEKSLSPSSCFWHLLPNNLAYSLNTGRLLPSR